MTDLFKYGKFDPHRPKVITSEHTMEEFFDALKNHTTVTVVGFNAPSIHVLDEDQNFLPKYEEKEKGGRVYSAEIHLTVNSETFYITSIIAGSQWRDEDYIINGAMRHSEDANYYGTNRWNTKHCIRWDSRNNEFTYYEEEK